NGAWGVLFCILLGVGRRKQVIRWYREKRAIKRSFEVSVLSADRVMDGDKKYAGHKIRRMSMLRNKLNTPVGESAFDLDVVDLCRDSWQYMPPT
ncbi:hypothetical protein C0992_011121, partial [Termitomyces sp. T32_za158]